MDELPAPDGGASAGAGLRRRLRRIDVLALTVNVIVGAGVFAMPSAVAAAAGRYSLLVLLAAFVIVALLAMCLVEVASRYDVTGGPPVYAADAFGPLAGFVVGWLLALSRMAASPAVKPFSTSAPNPPMVDGHVAGGLIQRSSDLDHLGSRKGAAHHCDGAHRNALVHDRDAVPVSHLIAYFDKVSGKPGDLALDVASEGPRIVAGTIKETDTESDSADIQVFTLQHFKGGEDFSIA